MKGKFVDNTIYSIINITKYNNEPYEKFILAMASNNSADNNGAITTSNEGQELL